MVTLKTKTQSKSSEVVLVKSSPLIGAATTIPSTINNSSLIKSPISSSSSSTTTTTTTLTSVNCSSVKSKSICSPIGGTPVNPINVKRTNCVSSSSELIKSPNQFCAILDDFVSKFSTDSGQKLTCLNLSFCSLKSIPNQITKFKCLKNLNLSCNELTSITFPSSNDTIESLALSFNQIAINESTLQLIASTFTHLVKLNLSYNSIGDSNDLRLRIDFSSFKFLRELNVSGIYWRNLRGIKGNSIIERFYLHSSGLMGLPSFVGFDLCVSLDLSNNEINFDRRTIQRIVRYLPSLRYLDISGNLDNYYPDFRWTDKWSKVEMVKTRCSNDINPSPVIMAMSNKFLSDLSSLTVVEFNSPSGDNPSDCRKGILIGLITGDPNAGQLASNLKRIFEAELMCPETWGSYMKNTILSCYKFLDEERILRLEKIKNQKKVEEENNANGEIDGNPNVQQTEESKKDEKSTKESSNDCQQSNRNSRKELANINIILCHLVAESDNLVKLRLSHCGSDVKIRLVKVSPPMPTNNDKENRDTSANTTATPPPSTTQSTSSSSTAVVTSPSSSSPEKQSDNSSNNQLLSGQEANSYTSCTQREVDLFEAHSFTITDPICQELVLTNDQEIVFLGINFMLNEDRQLNKILQSKGFTLHDKLKRYTELESSARNTDDVISFAIQLPPRTKTSSIESKTDGSATSVSSNSMEFTEKYKSWECIVTQNQNFKFNQRLITMPLTKNLMDITNCPEKKDTTSTATKT